MKKIFLAAVLAAVCGSFSYGGQSSPDALAGSPLYSDPVFQDYIETAYGYLNPANRFLPAPVYRDAVASPAQASVFLIITPAKGGAAGLLERLSAAGFLFAGERTSYAGGGKVTRLLGRASPGSVEAIRKVEGVAGVRVDGKKAKRSRAA